jgi:hypothetical protein
MINLNAKSCATDKKGTGLAACIVELGFPRGFIRTDRSWSEVIASGTLNKEYFVKEVQKMNFIPFIGAADFANNTAEATTQESANGLLRKIRNGKPLLDFTYWKGYPFHKIASSYNSYGSGDVILVFEQGILVVKSVDGTKVSAFKLGMQNAGTFTFNDGTNGEQVMVGIQLQDESEFNLRGEIITNETLGFNVGEDLPEIVDANVVLDDLSTGTDVKATITAVTNSAFNIKGLLAANFRIIIEGVAEAPSSVAYNDVTNKYVFVTSTTLSSTDTVQVELYDSVESLNVAVLADQLFRGISAVGTVA